MSKDLNGIVRNTPFDNRGKHDFRPVRSSLVTPTTSPTPDEEEESKLIWRPCTKCHALPDDGQFRLVCFSYRQLECRVCKLERTRSCEAFVAKGLSLEQQASDFLKKKGVRLNYKGEVRSQRQKQEPWEKEVGAFPRPQGFKGYKR